MFLALESPIVFLCGGFLIYLFGEFYSKIRHLRDDMEIICDKNIFLEVNEILTTFEIINFYTGYLL